MSAGPWRQIAPEVALLQYPLRAFGVNFGRNVTLLRLRDGRIVVHSTAPFSPTDVAAIRRFGEPAWLVDATLLHDTFAKPARAAFPAIPYLAPPGFEQASGVATQPLHPPPPEWAGEIDVIAIDGLRKIREHAFFHRASGTLVLADLLFHFPGETRGWPRFFVRSVMRLPQLRGISTFFRLMIRNREKFTRSMERILALEFTRIVVAHQAPFEGEARPALVRALEERGLDPEGKKDSPLA